MEPFTWTIDEHDIEDLRDRLARTRWPEQLPGDPGWTKGTPVDEARAWAADLAAFDWQGLRDELNALPQWTARIDGADIHLVHVRSEREDAIPLLLLHGWPGTALELVDLVGPLTAPPAGEPAFHVVIPSHPGTGLSGRTQEAGWGVPRTARAYAALMAELGYDAYVVQGGDHGAVLAPHMGRVDTDHVRAVHVNAASLGFMPTGEVDPETEDFTPLEQRRLESIGRFMSDGMGYNVIQATRPQTIGYGLEDSPAALLAFILEKVQDWTHDPARLDDPHYRRRHLGDVLIYWLTRTATSTADNVYASYGELFADPQAAFANSGVPTAVIAFAEDISIRRYAEEGNTIVRWTDVDTGGHFAALEQPEDLVADLRAFVGDLAP